MEKSHEGIKCRLPNKVMTTKYVRLPARAAWQGSRSLTGVKAACPGSRPLAGVKVACQGKGRQRGEEAGRHAILFTYFHDQQPKEP